MALIQKSSTSRQWPSQYDIPVPTADFILTFLANTAGTVIVSYINTIMFYLTFRSIPNTFKALLDLLSNLYFSFYLVSPISLLQKSSETS